MKKILVLLSSISIFSTTSSFVVSCGDESTTEKIALGTIITELNLGELAKDSSNTSVNRPSKETIYNKLAELHNEKWSEKNISFKLEDFEIPEKEWNDKNASITALESSNYKGKVLVSYSTK
ncbi:hypothetical protein SCORR_v1c05060 [Spiroplasma corruscae]|uniref:Lipoprotein n=1 Tax=Spiroplasma corruscae TaxID=216934 RepID=A0A222EP44_9MOLU|nr:lipoprotein [Spiroplasma corruscae]ASP28278.1 hypothetical protein SCORR_v1c05060 [Spiroplasma corruscae]